MCQRLVVQKSVFRKNWVGSKMFAGMKTISFAIFEAIWTHSLPQKDPNKKFFKPNFSFQSIRKMEVILLSIFLTLG